MKGFSQAVVLQNDFNTYVGTTATVQAGWYYSWNAGSSTAGSYYTSTTYSGAAPNAYKFGQNNDTIITPSFIPADTLSFWCKGSSTINDTNALSIYQSADSSTWVLLVSIDSLPKSGTTFKFGLGATTKFLKFTYTKISGNLAFDDVMVTSNATGIADNGKENNDVIIYPNPSLDGKFTVQSSESGIQNIDVYNIMGEKIYSSSLNFKLRTLNLSEAGSGIYFYKLKSLNQIISTGKLVIQ